MLASDIHSDGGRSRDHSVVVGGWWCGLGRSRTDGLIGMISQRKYGIEIVLDGKE